jgi:hypothetical protein
MSSASALQEEAAEVPVRFEDQKEINEFGKLNSRKYEIREDLEAVEVRPVLLEIPSVRSCSSSC